MLSRYIERGGSMNIFDSHCDVLYKMFIDPSIDFRSSSGLHVDYEKLQEAGSKVQCFAVYVPESVHPNMKFHAALYMIELFYDRVLKPFPKMKHIKERGQAYRLKEDEIGAVLTLEGCDCIGDDLLKLKTLLRLGVSSVGLTWNYSNYAADGALEERGAGLSSFGKKAVKILNEKQCLCDVSHLSEKGFWDVMELAEYPFASHSNCHALCPVPRNLNDNQLKALIERDSVIGLTFVPEFLTGTKQSAITDILKHVEHVCSLGGEDHAGFGSDFDGIDDTVDGLSSFKYYGNLVNELQKHYSEIQVEKFLFRNMEKRLPPAGRNEFGG
jgi:membrane dipeptidase